MFPPHPAARWTPSLSRIYTGWVCVGLWAWVCSVSVGCGMHGCLRVLEYGQDSVPPLHHTVSGFEPVGSCPKVLVLLCYDRRQPCLWHHRKPQVQGRSEPRIPASPYHECLLLPRGGQESSVRYAVATYGQLRGLPVINYLFKYIKKLIDSICVGLMTD